MHSHGRDAERSIAMLERHFDNAMMTKRATSPRRASSILLPITGLLYPFAVYFGMDKFSTPVFASVLAAIWLIRFPSLSREPGGYWLLATALAYCALLALSRNAWLLRWYPCLLSLVLLCVFALSLFRGQSIIERLARSHDPDLPPAGVRYTRVVTYVWVGFFTVNATVSAALTQWASLRWWTLYNGLLVYFIMGALLGGEWLIRQRRFQAR